jgi:hypothetical protein
LYGSWETVRRNMILEINGAKEERGEFR